MKKYIKRTKGKRNRTSLALPNHKGICKIKSITYNKNGIVENSECPACDGEGVDFLDFTNSRGGSVQWRLCDICDGYGVATEDKDYEIKTFYDHTQTQQFEYSKLNKEKE